MENTPQMPRIARNKSPSISHMESILTVVPNQFNSSEDYFQKLPNTGLPENFVLNTQTSHTLGIRSLLPDIGAQSSSVDKWK